MFNLFRSLVCCAAATLLALSIFPLQASPSQQQDQLQSAKAAATSPVITLASSELEKSGSAKVASTSAPLANETEATQKMRVARANYREFEKVKMRESSHPESFVLKFHAPTKLSAISATGDFQITGGNCAEGRAYLSGESCQLEVTFTPSGPGHRVGQLKVEHTASITPFLAPLGGTAYGSAISFTPSLINTVSGTYVSGTVGGLISGPGQLATDGGDNLYIADPGNHLIRFRDSSGAITTLIGGGATSLTTTSSGFGTALKLNAPTGVAADYEGNLYFSDNADKLIGTYFTDSIAVRSAGLGATAENGCYTGSKCTPTAVAMDPPTTLAVDISGNVFSASTYGNGLPGSEIAEYTALTSPVQFYEVGTTAYNYYSTSNAVSPDPFGYGNLYYTYLDPGTGILSPTPVCHILGQNSTYTQNGGAGERFWQVAGSGPCGFSGDGGRAVSAEISKLIGQFAWDAAGNFYFTDSGNNRVRRIDSNGIIRTIAGNGGTGTGGSGGPSTSAALQAPVGLATDSTGRVYVTAVATVANKYDISSFGTVGSLNFGTVAVATHAPAQTVLVSNVGNESLNFTHEGFAAGSTGDFPIDPNTTSCNFTVPLLSGQSCNVGFIFTPSAAGVRTATLNLLDDTATGSNTIQLTGTGATTATLSPASIAFASRAVGSASAATVVTLQNTGTGLLTITTGGIKFTGTSAASFSETTTCGSTLAAGASCTISVVFKPTVAGAISAALAVTDNAIGGLQSVVLTGTATATAKPALTPGAVTFAAQTVKTASAPSVISIKNTTSGPLSLTAFSIAGANAVAFTQTHGCSATLAVGASCAISVVFKPTTVGSQAATLTVSSSQGALTAALGGAGKASLSISPKPAAPRGGIQGFASRQ